MGLNQGIKRKHLQEFIPSIILIRVLKNKINRILKKANNNKNNSNKDSRVIIYKEENN